MKVLVIQHVPAEGLGALDDFLTERSWEIDVKYEGAGIPGDLDDYNALIVLGGPMGAYEEDLYPYLRIVQDLVREAARKHLPVLGICLGAQLIAQALGAMVGPNPVKEIGWYQVELTEQGKELFASLPPAFSVFQWHGDTFTLPPGGVPLAKGETCTNQAFIYGDTIWAFQFHFELTPEMINDWCNLYEDELTEFGGQGLADSILRETASGWDEYLWSQKYFMDRIEAVFKGA
ncbi:MAG: type 1 glutamine amidotransferase [Syntrophomonas sp.]